MPPHWVGLRPERGDFHGELLAVAGDAEDDRDAPTAQHRLDLEAPLAQGLRGLGALIGNSPVRHRGAERVGFFAQGDVSCAWVAVPSG